MTKWISIVQISSRRQWDLVGRLLFLTTGVTHTREISLMRFSSANRAKVPKEVAVIPMEATGATRQLEAAPVAMVFMASGVIRKSTVMSKTGHVMERTYATKYLVRADAICLFLASFASLPIGVLRAMEGVFMVESVPKRFAIVLIQHPLASRVRSSSTASFGGARMAASASRVQEFVHVINLFTAQDVTLSTIL